jgi:hypothetical protein
MPSLTGLDAPTFGENTVNATPQVLDTDVVFTDVEGDFDGGTLTVSGLLAEDTVSVQNQGTGAGQIGLSGANVTYEGVIIGTLAGGAGATLTITFNAQRDLGGHRRPAPEPDLRELQRYADGEQGSAAQHHRCGG